MGNFTTPSAQNRKQPTKPAMANSIACVIQASTMKQMMAKACCVCGASPSGANQTASGTSTLTAKLTSGHGVLAVSARADELRSVPGSTAGIIGTFEKSGVA